MKRKRYYRCQTKCQNNKKKEKDELRKVMDAVYETLSSDFTDEELDDFVKKKSEELNRSKDS